MSQKVKKFIVLLSSDDWEEPYRGFDFNTKEDAETFAKTGWREKIEDLDNGDEVQEDRIFIAEIQTLYVNNPTFVRVCSS